MLAEASTTEISKVKKPKTFVQSKKIAQQGGTIAGNTRKEIEEKTGQNVITSQNAKSLRGKNKEIKEWLLNIKKMVADPINHPMQ